MNKRHAQSGFTLLELLIALTLVVVVLLTTQRYIAGLAGDHRGISERHTKATQLRIALSNMQRDVAQAGYYPYAQAGNPKNKIGVFIHNNKLTIASYQPKSSARDCNGAAIQLENTDWVYVANTYSLENGSLRCDGNGGNNGALAVLDGVSQLKFSALTNGSVHVCLITQESQASLGEPLATTDCNDAALANQGTHHYKISVEMPVHTFNFPAGSSQ
ncbi:MAG: prepilin-type N-terminal cleavage/methylation domain-containing protein [Formosimonas sp.]